MSFCEEKVKWMRRSVGGPKSGGLFKSLGRALLRPEISPSSSFPLGRRRKKKKAQIPTKVTTKKMGRSPPPSPVLLEGGKVGHALNQEEARPLVPSRPRTGRERHRQPSPWASPLEPGGTPKGWERTAGRRGASCIAPLPACLFPASAGGQ